jgi:hypothetical protein
VAAEGTAPHPEDPEIPIEPDDVRAVAAAVLEEMVDADRALGFGPGVDDSGQERDQADGE